jgi:hypothetical protein
MMRSARGQFHGYCSKIFYRNQSVQLIKSTPVPVQKNLHYLKKRRHQAITTQALTAGLPQNFINPEEEKNGLDQQETASRGKARSNVSVDTCQWCLQKEEHGKR